MSERGVANSQNESSNEMNLLDPRNWTTAEVISKWLVPHSLQTYFASLFEKNEIDGKILLDLEMKDIFQIIGNEKIPYGKIKYLEKELKHIKEFINSRYKEESYLKNLPSPFDKFQKELKFLFADDNKTVIRVLENLVSKQSEPFQDDQEYLEYIEAMYLIQRQIFQIQAKLRNDLTKDFSSNLFYINSSFDESSISERWNYFANYSDRLLYSLDQIKQKIKSICQLKLNHQLSKKPKVLLLCEKFNLTPKEIEAFQFILICNISADFSIPTSVSHAEQRSMLQLAAKYAEMNSKEILNFFHPSRHHMKQNLFEVEEYSNFWSSTFLVISNEVLRILCGSIVSTDDIFKIDKTSLSEIIEENNLLPEITKSKVKESSKLPKKEIKSEDLESELEILEKQIEEEKDQDLQIEKKDDQDLLKDSLSTEESEEEKFNLEGILKHVKLGETSANPQKEEKFEKENEEPEQSIQPYKKDLDYLDDSFAIIDTKIKIKKIEIDGNEDEFLQKRKPEAVLRELKAKLRTQQAKLEKRLKLTFASGSWLPRIERLVELRSLDPFEKNVLLALIGGTISQPIRKHFDKTETLFKGNFDVASLVTLFAETLEDQIRCRTYFYKNSKLVKEGIIRLIESPFKKSADLMETNVEVDRRLLDYIVGLDTELSEIVDGSDLFYPKVSFFQVILPDETKNLILDTLQNFDTFKKVVKDIGYEDQLTYGYGICMLFFGASGTGKTMTAHGIAHKLGKKLLLVNISALGDYNLTKEMLRFIFREAKIHNAIIFFDECENLFESRNQKVSPVNILLTEIERYDGLIILATNRAFDLDEALHRRINLALEFLIPDFTLRQEIWKEHLPSNLQLSNEVDLKELAMNYELTGGLIKNACLSALAFAIARDSNTIVITQADLDKGSKLQLRGHLQQNDFAKIIPTQGFNGLILESSLLSILKDIVRFEKAKKILYAHWGFVNIRNYQSTSTLLIFHGPSGTGKTMSAQALAFELGKPLKETNSGEILSKYTSSSAKNIETIFKEGKDIDALLLFDKAEGLFGSMHRNATFLNESISSALLYQINRYPGIVILETDDISKLNIPQLTSLKFILDFKKPDASLRLQIWEKLFPEKTPKTDSINLKKLASEFEFTPFEITNVLIRAAEQAALRQDENKKVSFSDLMDAALVEQKNLNRRNELLFENMYQ